MYDLIVGKKTEVVDEISKYEAESDVWTGSQRHWQRVFCIVDGVHCGVTPQCAEAGDLAVIVLETQVPLAFKKKNWG